MGNRQFVRVLDGRTRALKGVLANAADVGYKRVLNDLWTGQFSLPAHDAGNALVGAHDLVEFTDGRRGTVRMRVVEQPEDQGGGNGTFVPYALESVNATLLDDLFFGYQEIGGEGMRTRACIEWVLARQTTARWVLRRCDFDYAYSYVMQNNNLLTLLYSLTTCFLDRYQWVFDTDCDPWAVDLIATPATRECGIVYARNLDAVKRGWNGRPLVNRLYCAGYGEGTNLLTIRGVNGGLPYVQDDASVARYGVKAGMYCNKAIEDAAVLKATALAALQATAWPAYTYTATLADIYEMTGLDFDRIQEGRVVWVYDRERGADFEARVLSVTRADIGADPYDTVAEISDAAPEIADAVAALASRVGIAELYSQGATQVYGERYADNADFSHPAAWSVYVDADARTINSILLRIRMEKFRGYTMAAASGGGSSQTSGAGGASAVTSEAGGYSSGAKYTGGKLDSDSHGSAPYTEAPNLTVFAGHKHADQHVHALTVTTPSHTHDVSVPGHSHTVEIPSHTHEITYGIYEGPQAALYTLYVDNSPVPSAEIVDGTVDIAPWLETDTQGRITRGAWHTIEVVPMGLTRVVMEMYVRLYIQSIGGTVL
ncbi:MAG: phage tail spike protein [Candidatus Limiplasma sp.]|nr:phage tail spike protein [Candidatus Limiplasma sp.]